MVDVLGVAGGRGAHDFQMRVCRQSGLKYIIIGREFYRHSRRVF